jgi:hypothetical protein
VAELKGKAAAVLGSLSAAGGAALFGWSGVVMLGAPVVAVLLWLAWVLESAPRTKRLGDLIREARTPPRPPTEPPPQPPPPTTPPALTTTAPRAPD